MTSSKSRSGGGTVSDDVRSLLQRRSTLQEWLSKLDELGGRYSPEVAGRVRSDYEARVATVARELEGHRAAIEFSLDERRSIHKEILGRSERASAEIEEAELRYEIGELDEGEWSSRRGEHRKKLDGIQAELSSAESAVGELETVLADIAVPGRASVVPAPKPEPEPEVVEPAEEIAEPEPVSEPAAEEDAFRDELEFLESLSLDDADSFDAVSRMLDDEESSDR